jgi:UDP-sulfoquinovose synthase
MRVLILGGDGYLGWPTAMGFASKGHEVHLVDNYLRRLIAQQTQSEALMPNPNLVDRATIFKALSGYEIGVTIGDVTNYRILSKVFQEFQPETVIHYAEQPSGPYSMIGYDEARLTLENNLISTHNVIFAVMAYAPDCQIIKIGTMGEYGTPNIDIPEGWIEIQHRGKSDTFLFPRAAGTQYHTCKVLETDYLYFYVRTFGIRVTDLMQGPVYGLLTPESELDERLLPNFHYDDIFGTAMNRFLVQAVAGVPLTVYGKGGQTRGYLDIRDTLQCVELAMLNPTEPGKLRVLNQFVETFSINRLAGVVQRVGNQMGLNVKVESIPNPRKELEDHYYNPDNSGLIDLGLQPHYMTDDVVAGMLAAVSKYKDRIDTQKIMPRVRWKQ